MTARRDVQSELCQQGRLALADVTGHDPNVSRLQAPGEVVQDVVAEHVFAGSGLDRTVIGSPGSIAALTRDQVVRHWRRHYGPSSLVVAAAGHVDHDRLVEQLASLDARPHGPALRSPK